MAKQTRHQKSLVPRRRGTVSKSSSKLVSFWIPIDMYNLIEKALKAKDTDRSKWMREAIRKQINHS